MQRHGGPFCDVHLPGCTASYRNCQFFVAFPRSLKRFGTVELQGFLERYSQGLNQFRPGLRLAVHARKFSDPADPPLARALDDGCVVLFHQNASYQPRLAYSMHMVYI